ncbi:MAG: hypothetical protein K8T20_04595 [Planctomycetes bacterium]|nr:hypothetical protein [Planctomycetota bacterium]
MNPEGRPILSLSQRLHDTFEPKLQDLATALRGRFPACVFHVLHVQAAERSDHPHFLMYLDCLFPRMVPGACDNLALEIEAWDLDGRARINAGLTWGQCDLAEETSESAPKWATLMPPDFDDTWTSSKDWPAATLETLARLEADFPRLMKSFEEIVARASALLV